MNIKKEIENNRKAIKPSWNLLREIKTDRELELPRPVMFKSPNEKATIISLLNEFPNIAQISLTEAIAKRRSLRAYQETPLTFEEVSYILYETSRVNSYKSSAVFRSIPTGGATNAMETYILINNVKDIEKGLYLYVQDKHELALIDDDNDISERVNKALNQQLRGAGIVLFFTAVPYRSEYKYSFTAHKMIAMEAGHAGQNASLVSEAIDCGACCLAAYNQELCDDVLQLDGEEEFTTYAITIGKR